MSSRLSCQLRRPLRAVVATALLGAVVTAPAITGPTHAAVQYVAWSAVLPGWTDEFIPTSANDCVAGRANCVKQTVKELDHILQSTGRSCSHNAVFALAYTRMTQTFGWSSQQPNYYEDVPFATHQSAVFAKHYTDAFTSWANGDRANVPQAWLTAFDAAAGKKVTGTGDLLLGMNAHINRDLPHVIATVGMVAPDGSSRKKDFDQVEDFLAKASKPMAAESAQRFDPTMDDGADPLDATYSATMQVVVAWRENAWRNAEALVNAPDPAARNLVEARIENEANAIAESILATESYSPPLTSSAARDAYCVAHHGDQAPVPYPFGTPDPYGT